MKVLAVEDLEDAEPLEAIPLDDKKPELGLIGWWSNYAWESIERHVTLEDLLRDPKWRRFDMDCRTIGKEATFPSSRVRLNLSMASLRSIKPAPILHANLRVWPAAHFKNTRSSEFCSCPHSNPTFPQQRVDRGRIQPGRPHDLQAPLLSPPPIRREAGE